MKRNEENGTRVREREREQWVNELEIWERYG
jgi:hypothetical protein